MVVLCGLLVASSSLGVGFFIDDWFHLAMLDDDEFLSHRGALDLFAFVKSDDPVLSSAQGLPSPWWTASDFRAAFWRPLTSLTHKLDHQLWGYNAVGHHATTLVLWAALLASVCLFFRELSRDWGRAMTIVTVAGLIYAFDDAHNWNFGWVANRNAVVSVLFSVLALVHYHRFRNGAGSRALAFSLCCYGLGLAGGETAISVVLWASAYELSLGRGSIGQRASALAPIVVVTAVYLVLWQQAGYGTAGSGLYVSPFDRPLDFVVLAVTRRIPLLLSASVGVIPAEASTVLSSSLEGWDIGLACGVLGVVSWALWPLLRRDPVCRFMAMGAALSTVPVAATFPSNRLLLFPTLGVAWVLACFIVDTLGRRDRMGSSVMSVPNRLRSLIASVLFLVHLVAAPVSVVGGMGVFAELVRQLDQFAAGAELPEGAGAAGAQVLLLNSPDPVTPTYLALMRRAAGGEVPQALWQVSIVPGDQVLRRTSLNSFTLEAGPPGFLVEFWESLFRASPEVTPGDVFRRGEMLVTADQVTDGRLERIEVQVERSLDDPDVHLLAWNGERWARVAAPPLGDCALLPMDGYVIPMAHQARPSLAHLCPTPIQSYATAEAQARPSSVAPVTDSSAPQLASAAGQKGQGDVTDTGRCRLEVSTG
ncbi:MAG TPA: hypothetical protein DIU15_16280, partial [Deltaproteobacteria bacterium]|nr:hypothetical protein [Deltaproteobacteria bacterium]